MPVYNHSIDIHCSTLSPLWFRYQKDEATALILLSKNNNEERPIIIRARWNRYNKKNEVNIHTPYVELTAVIDSMTINPESHTHDVTALEDIETPYLVIYEGPNIIPENINEAIINLKERWKIQDTIQKRDLPGRIITAIQLLAHQKKHWAAHGAFLINKKIYSHYNDAISPDEPLEGKSESIVINDPDADYYFSHPKTSHEAEEESEQDETTEDEQFPWRTLYTVQKFHSLLIYIPPFEETESQHKYTQKYRQYLDIIDNIELMGDDNL